MESGYVMSMKKLFDVDKHNLMFHNKALFALLIPIVVEQLLNSFMGMVDTMMVSNLGSQISRSRRLLVMQLEHFL